MKIDGVERAAASEAIRFVKKDRSKLKFTLGLYALSFKSPELGKVTRATYFFARHLDDVLDGELDITQDPVDYALSFREQIKSDKFNSSKIGRLGNYALPILEAKARSGDSPRNELTGLIDTLIYDHDRRIERKALNSGELSEYYGNVLNPGINLMMIGFNSGVRAEDVPGYAPSLGRLYSVRDLEKDWRLGIINVPKTVLNEASLTTVDEYSQLTSSPSLQSWARDEVEAAGDELRSAQKELDRIAEPFPATVLNVIANNALRVAA